MKKHYAALLLGLLAWELPKSYAQDARYQTRAGTISFFSASPLEDIEARSQQAAALVDMQTGQLAFSLPIRSFEFKRSLMQEHFNENYMESERYPKATFTGHLVDWNADALQGSTAPHAVVAEGDLTIHGVTRRVRAPGTLAMQNGQLVVNSSFSVAPADYQIKIPALVRDHIAKSVLVTVRLTCAPVRTTAASHP
ncbi:hypothetical protein GCM10027346_13670 [Hymenobacter seoulensis]